MADSPAKYRDRVLSYSVYADGVKVNDKYSMTYAEVRLCLNKIGKAVLKFNAGDMDAQTFGETDADTFKPGTAIKLDAGDVDSEETIFEGMVIQLKIEVEGGKRSQMVVECKDSLFAATLGRKNRIFEEKTDSAIMEEILKNYGSASVEATEYTHKTLVQYYCTDWDFVLSRAEVNGMFIYMKEGGIHVGKPEIDGEAVLTVTYGNDLIEFDGGVSVSDQFEAIEAVSWDPVQQAIVQSSANPPTLNQQGDLAADELKGGEKQLWQTDAPTPEAALQQWVDGMALKNGLARFQGSFMFYGCAKVVPGSIIELAGMGNRFNGNVFAGQVEHLLENNVWTSRVYMGVTPTNITDEPDVTAPPASGWLPGIEGLHIGKVKKMDEDPDGEYRIQVELPWFNGDKKELWARLAMGYAGSKYGYFFFPEPGDEVVVGFFNNDPCHPVILGSMYSSKQAPDFQAESGNNIKAIVSREQLKITLDDEKKVLSIQTPAENKIEINDEGKSITLSDENDNKLILDKNGITIQSAKDITLKAQSNIMLDATSKVSVSAKSDVEIEGTNIKNTAKVGFTAKGNATAEVSASGQTTIKGGMVMIN